MTPRVAVIVPVRNRRSMLLELLGALDAQTYRDAELVVVDDGSADGSADAVADATVFDRPVRVLRSAGVGAVAARELGVASVDSPLLAFTDSDCQPEPGWLGALVQAAEAGADVVVGTTVPARAHSPLERTLHAGDDGLFATCNVLYRRAAFESAGGFDRSAQDRLGFRPTARAKGLGMGEDTLLGWRVARAGTADFVPDAVVRHAVHPPDLADSILRGWMAAGFPALFVEVPELADRLLRPPPFLGSRRRLPLAVSVVLALAGRRRAAALAVAWWAYERVPELRRGQVRLRRWPPELAALLAVDAATLAGLVVGSVKARRLVL